MTIIRRLRLAAVSVIAVAGAMVLAVPVLDLSVSAQQPSAPPAIGLYNWIHSTADSEKAFPFYRDVLGIALARSPFGGPAPANAPPERIRPVSNAAPDPLVWDLTDTKGSRFRNVFMHAPNTPFGLELSEFLDIPRETRIANPWDPGASSIIVQVRDLDSVVAKAAAGEAPIVTLGGTPVPTPAGRALLVRDPDGYLVQLTQAPAAAIAAAAAGDQVVGMSIGITVANMARSMAFYRGLLGFDIHETRTATPAELRLHGLSTGQLTQTRTTISGTNITVVFSEFTLPAGGPTAAPFRWRIQDVGAPQFQLQVRDLDALIAQTKQAGYRFLSVGARPIQRAFGRFVFAIDPDGVLVEYVERAAPR